MADARRAAPRAGNVRPARDVDPNLWLLRLSQHHRQSVLEGDSQRTRDRQRPRYQRFHLGRRTPDQRGPALEGNRCGGALLARGARAGLSLFSCGAGARLHCRAPQSFSSRSRPFLALQLTPATPRGPRQQATAKVLGAAPVILRAVDVGERRDKTNPAARQVRECILKCVWGGPPHPLERLQQARASAQADQPIAAIDRRAEHSIPVAEEAKGQCDMARADGRDVGANDDKRARGVRLEQTLHALAEIAGTLSTDRNLRRPDRASRKAVWTDGQDRLPACIGSEPTDKGRGGGAREARRLARANFGREPALRGAGHWRLDHNDEPAAKGRRARRRSTCGVAAPCHWPWALRRPATRP